MTNFTSAVDKAKSRGTTDPGILEALARQDAAKTAYMKSTQTGDSGTYLGWSANPNSPARTPTQHNNQAPGGGQFAVGAGPDGYSQTPSTPKPLNISQSTVDSFYKNPNTQASNNQAPGGGQFVVGAGPEGYSQTPSSGRGSYTMPSASDGGKPYVTPNTQAPGTQAPSTQVPNTQAPGTQVEDSRSMGEFQNQVPMNPRSDIDSLAFLGPNLRNVNAAQDTVQGQLAQLYNQNNPVLQMARQRGLEQASKQGMLNSSLAGQASELAFLNQATDIATKDAGTYFDQGKTNQDFENRFLSELQGLGISTTQAGVQGDIDKDKLREEYRLRGEILGQEYGLKAQELAQQFGYDIHKEGAKQATALHAQYMQAVAEINKADMKLADKTAQIESLRESMISALANSAHSFTLSPDEYLSYIQDTYDTVGESANNVFGTDVTEGISNGGADDKGTYWNIPSNFPGLGDGGDQWYTKPDGTSERINRDELNPDTKYREGDPLPAGFTWGVDPATGLFGIIPPKTTPKPVGY